MSSGEVPSPLYVDTSVLVAALAPDEVHHVAALACLADARHGIITSVLAEVELGRALSRRQAPTALRSTAGRLLAGCELVDVTEEIRTGAIAIAPSSLRSLDAVHVATAVVAGAAAFASYDVRQRLAAEEAGLTIAT